MKKLLLLFAAVAAAYPVSAQRNMLIRKDSVQFLPGTFHYKTADMQKFKLFKGDTAQYWNYSSLTAKGDTSYTFLQPSYKIFKASAAALADTGKAIALTSNNTWVGQDVYDIDTNGIFYAGRYVKGKTFSLYKYFADTKDSLYIPEQADYCHINFHPFPDSFKRSYQLAATRTMNFKVTVNTVGYNKTPGSKVTYFVVNEKTAGWGGMRVPSSNKYSPVYGVLMVKQKIWTVDSFFINQKPADPLFMSALGMNQAVRSASYKELFYREGYANPLMEIDFADSNFTSPVRAIYSEDSVHSGILLTMSGLENFALYPNPVNQGLLYYRFEKEDPAPWKLTITNTNGQTMISTPVNGSGDIVQYQNVARLDSGLYIFRLTDGKGEVKVTARFTKQ